jgi:hypothetical protein
MHLFTFEDIPVGNDLYIDIKAEIELDEDLEIENIDIDKFIINGFDQWFKVSDLADDNKNEMINKCKEFFEGDGRKHFYWTMGEYWEAYNCDEDWSKKTANFANDLYDMGR